MERVQERKAPDKEAPADPLELGAPVQLQLHPMPSRQGLVHAVHSIPSGDIPPARALEHRLEHPLERHGRHLVQPFPARGEGVRIGRKRHGVELPIQLPELLIHGHGRLAPLPAFLCIRNILEPVSRNRAETVGNSLAPARHVQGLPQRRFVGHIEYKTKGIIAVSIIKIFFKLDPAGAELGLLPVPPRQRLADTGRGSHPAYPFQRNFHKRDIVDPGHLGCDFPDQRLVCRGKLPAQRHLTEHAGGRSVGIQDTRGAFHPIPLQLRIGGQQLIRTDAEAKQQPFIPDAVFPQERFHHRQGVFKQNRGSQIDLKCPVSTHSRPLSFLPLFPLRGPELFRPVGGDESVDDLVQLSVQNAVDFVKRQADAGDRSPGSGESYRYGSARCGRRSRPASGGRPR